MHGRVETSASTPARQSLAPTTEIGIVKLTVASTARSQTFYEQALGLVASRAANGVLRLGAKGGETLIEVHEDASAQALDRRKTGLFHLAILFPSRAELARALRRLGEARWPLEGASDHLVSEALYLSDPDGNGIELYRDRAREDWPRSNGQIQMATLPLDLRDLLDEVGDHGAGETGAPRETKIGHIHLQVSELEQSEDFYSRLLGFDVTVRGYPGALFLSAGGYHHHIGLNTWNSAGAAPPAPDAIGLREYEIVLSDDKALEGVRKRISAASAPFEASDEGLRVRDPSGNRLLLRFA